MMKKRVRWLLHYVIILGALFLAYPLGNKLLGFTTGGQVWTLVKMALFFYPVLVLADVVAERLMKL